MNIFIIVIKHLRFWVKIDIYLDIGVKEINIKVSKV